jgi:hypothetical protein
MTSHTCSLPLVEIRYKGLSVVKASMKMTVYQNSMKEIIQNMDQ